MKRTTKHTKHTKQNTNRKRKTSASHKSLSEISIVYAAPELEPSDANAFP